MEEMTISETLYKKLSISESIDNSFLLTYERNGGIKLTFPITKKDIALIYQIMNTKEVTDELFSEFKKGEIK